MSDTAAIWNTAAIATGASIADMIISADIAYVLCSNGEVWRSTTAPFVAGWALLITVAATSCNRIEVYVNSTGATRLYITALSGLYWVDVAGPTQGIAIPWTIPAGTTNIPLHTWGTSLYTTDTKRFYRIYYGTVYDITPFSDLPDQMAQVGTINDFCNAEKVLALATTTGIFLWDGVSWHAWGSTPATNVSWLLFDTSAIFTQFDETPPTASTWWDVLLYVPVSGSTFTYLTRMPRGIDGGTYAANGYTWYPVTDCRFAELPKLGLTITLPGEYQTGELAHLYTQCDPYLNTAAITYQGKATPTSNEIHLGNLLHNGDCEATTAWTATLCTIATSTAQVKRGTNSILATYVGAGTAYVGQAVGALVLQSAIEAGYLTQQFWIYGGAANAARAYIKVGSTYSYSTTYATNGAYTLCQVTATVPDGTTTIESGISFTSGNHYMDAGYLGLGQAADHIADADGTFIGNRLGLPFYFLRPYVQLVGNGAAPLTRSPYFEGLIIRHFPEPDSRYSWMVNIDCSDSADGITRGKDTLAAIIKLIDARPLLPFHQDGDASSTTYYVKISSDVGVIAWEELMRQGGRYTLTLVEAV
jgi:hypothetical protein